MVFILILAGWEFLRKSDYKYSMLVLFEIAVSIKHNDAVPDLSMVPLWSEVQGSTGRVLLHVGVLVNRQRWCGLGLLQYVGFRAVVELGLSSQFYSPTPIPLQKKRASGASGTGRLLNN